MDSTPNPEEVIGKYAAICYDAKTDKESCIRRAIKCAADGHLATLRFAYATFLVEGVSRVCSHQFVRSKHLDFLQQSQRYVENNHDTTFTYPVGFTEEQKEALDYHYGNCIELYHTLREQGAKKEDARFVLPEATQTSLYVTGNFQAWSDFLSLRADKHAQWEIRQVAELIGYELFKVAPNLYKNYGKKEAASA